MKAAFLDYGTLGPGLDLTDMRALLPELTVHDNTAAQDVAQQLAGVEIAIANKVRFDESVLQANPQLRFIGLTATGTDNVDVEAASRAGIAVCNIRAYCTPSVAEHVFSVLLYLFRNLRQYDDAIRNGAWQSSTNFCLTDFPIRQLSGLTMGIVGYGDLGRGVAKLAAAFGMSVLISTRPGSHEIGDNRVAFDELLQRCDVISLHCPLNATTKNLFSQLQFAAMKPDAVLVNTARGGLVDSVALVNALRNGDIGGAAIDVLPTEPPIDGDPLLDYTGENLIVTPHVAWAAKEARQNALHEVRLNIEDFLRGGTRNRVN